MKILVDDKGAVHLDSSDDNVLEIHTQNDVYIYEDINTIEMKMIKKNGGQFDKVVAYSEEVEEFLNKQEQ